MQLFERIFLSKACNLVFLLGLSLFVSGCVTTGSERLMFPQSFKDSDYDAIKKIVIEEAAKNGFPSLTSEVRPSEFNKWSGQLFFSLVTPNGTDQLFVEFERKEGKVFMYMHGAGTRANPDSAIKAIHARLLKPS